MCPFQLCCVLGEEPHQTSKITHVINMMHLITCINPPSRTSTSPWFDFLASSGSELLMTSLLNDGKCLVVLDVSGALGEDETWPHDCVPHSKWVCPVCNGYETCVCLGQCRCLWPAFSSRFRLLSWAVLSFRWGIPGPPVSFARRFASISQKQLLCHL